MSKNNEVMEPEVIDENIDETELEVYEMEPEEESGVGLGKFVLGAALVAGGIGALCYKFRGKIEERRVEKLKKKGYVVIEPVDEDIVIDAEDVDDIEESEKESEEK